ncbi:MAG TPA: SPOR domain-containing protein [Bryobacteraceae bacterium]|nr:SPOR domain-containing protein [Bryobacteraceae bacterium]
MLHIWTPERFATATAASDNLAMDAPSVEDLRRNHALDEIEEYEFVLGRRQVASLSFVVLVLLSAFAGISYLMGRATVAHANTVAPPSKPVIEAAAGHPSAPPVAPAPEVKSPPTTSADLFADPIAGATYIQLAAVDRGIATIMAEGVRSHGLPSLVAPGPNDKIFRVLVGPFPDAAAHQQAKASLEQIGLSAFAQFQK